MKSTDDSGLLLCQRCSVFLVERTERCCRCGIPLPWPASPQKICGPCSTRARPWDHLWVLADYAGPAAEVVRAFKFRGLFFLGEQLGRHLAAEIARCELEAQAVVAVPMPWWRRYRRGLDHTRVLAAEVATSLELPLLGALRRVHGARFSGLSAHGRRRAPQTFRIRRGVKLPPTVLLVDDIVTTGETLESCARLLRRGGARRVLVAAVGRTPSPRERALGAAQIPWSPAP